LIFFSAGRPAFGGLPGFFIFSQGRFVFEPFAKSWANLAREPILPFEFPL